jgi:hypothetical protein
VHAPRPPSIDFLLAEGSGDQWELFCDVLFNIERDNTPELAQRREGDAATVGRLRPFVHCWMGSVLRFFEERLRRFGEGMIVTDRCIRTVVQVGLADRAPGAAVAWLKAVGKRVEDRFVLANVRLTTQAGGAGGFESVVAGFAAMRTSMDHLGRWCPREFRSSGQRQVGQDGCAPGRAGLEAVAARNSGWWRAVARFGGNGRRRGG